MTPRPPGNDPSVLRHPLVKKLVWSGLYAGLGALATMVARRTASGIWRKTTGEEPPAKK